MEMERQKKRMQVWNLLAEKIRKLVEESVSNPEELQEIRIRTGQPLLIQMKGQERVLPDPVHPYLVTKEDIGETMGYICHYSLYAYENELKQGFITVEGGHRVGVAGKVIIENEKVKNIQYISSLNVRISHEVLGCADALIPYITENKQICHTLIISPPCCGKTTLIRDLIRQISDGNEYIKGCSVGVVDERSELGGCYLGIAQNHLGTRTDILDCCPKAEGMIMLIRSMAPRVIAVDEIGTSEDIHAIEYAKAMKRMYSNMKIRFVNMNEFIERQDKIKETSDKYAKGADVITRFEARLGEQLMQMLALHTEEQNTKYLNEISGGYGSMTKQIVKVYNECGIQNGNSFFEQLANVISNQNYSTEELRRYLLKVLIGVRHVEISICGLYSYALYVRALDNNAEKDIYKRVKEHSWIPVLLESSEAEARENLKLPQMDDSRWMLLELDWKAQELYGIMSGK